MFRIPRMEDISELKSYLQYNDNKGCEYSLANNILWSDYYRSGYDIICGNLIFGSCSEVGRFPTSVSFPVGSNDIKKTLDAVFDMYKENNQKIVINLVSENNFGKLEQWYPGRFQIDYNRDWADYIYEKEKLATLSGSKLHSKRNHINRFIEKYPDYIYEKINESNYRDCIEYAHKWMVNNNKEQDESKAYEEKIIIKALENREKLGVIGALIRVEGEVIAFTLGERLSNDTFVVHFEKAEADIQGAYAIINRDFVRNELSDFRYVNREEDLGIEGLRKAKLSYHPAFLQQKGIVTER